MHKRQNEGGGYQIHANSEEDIVKYVHHFLDQNFWYISFHCLWKMFLIFFLEEESDYEAPGYIITPRRLSGTYLLQKSKQTPRIYRNHLEKSI